MTAPFIFVVNLQIDRDVCWRNVNALMLLDIVTAHLQLNPDCMHYRAHTTACNEWNLWLILWWQEVQPLEKDKCSNSQSLGMTTDSIVLLQNDILI